MTTTKHRPKMSRTLFKKHPLFLLPKHLCLFEVICYFLHLSTMVKSSLNHQLGNIYMCFLTFSNHPTCKSKRVSIDIQVLKESKGSKHLKPKGLPRLLLKIWDSHGILYISEATKAGKTRWVTNELMKPKTLQGWFKNKADSL